MLKDETKSEKSDVFVLKLQALATINEFGCPVLTDLGALFPNQTA